MSARQQKLVYLEGIGSFAMLGDKIEGCTGDNALAALLSAGWEIKSLHVLSEPHKSHGGPCGYAWLEK